MKVSDLYVANPVVSIQDSDLMYISVDDGIGGWDSGAFTFASLKNNIPTLYTSDGTLLADRTIDMDGMKALWENGIVGFGASGTLFSDILAMVQVFPNGERPAFAIGNFEGVQAQAGVLAFDTGEYIGGYKKDADITDTTKLRLLLGVGGTDGEFELNFYDVDGDPRIQMSAVPTASRAKFYDDSDQAFFEIKANGEWGCFGASSAQQTGGAATAGGSYGATEQTMLQKAYDAMRAFGMLD